MEPCAHNRSSLSTTAVSILADDTVTTAHQQTSISTLHK